MTLSKSFLTTARHHLVTLGHHGARQMHNNDHSFNTNPVLQKHNNYTYECSTVRISRAQPATPKSPMRRENALREHENAFTTYYLRAITFAQCLFVRTLLMPGKQPTPTCQCKTCWQLTQHCLMVLHAILAGATVWQSWWYNYSFIMRCSLCTVLYQCLSLKGYSVSCAYIKAEHFNTWVVNELWKKSTVYAEVS